MTWIDDPVLPGYEYQRLELADAPLAPGEPDDTVLAGGLVRTHEPRSRRAALYLHGWSDYFFQTELADFFEAQGYDFYAVELRRYGRGLGEGQLGGYVTDLADYFDELDRALEIIRADHDEVTMVAHSTGGLVASLWANERPGALHGLVLNSPWLDWHGSPMVRVATEVVATNLGRGAKAAVRTLPLPDSGVYLRSIHTSGEGEWDFDLALKRHASFTIRPGWVAAIMEGHRQVRQGLAIDTPVLSMMSARSDFSREWKADVHREVDTVLDVDNLARRSVRLGPHVTVVRVAGGLHDLFLSRAEVREGVYQTMRTWMSAWL